MIQHVDNSRIPSLPSSLRSIRIYVTMEGADALGDEAITLEWNELSLILTVQFPDSKASPCPTPSLISFISFRHPSLLLPFFF